MTSTVFPSGGGGGGGGGGGYKLDAQAGGKGDLAKPQPRGASESWGALGTPGVLGNIHNSGGGGLQLQGKAKPPGLGQGGQLQVVVACRPGGGGGGGGGQHPLGLGEGQEENWGGFGAQQQTPLTGRPTGGDPAPPTKSKTLLGQNNNSNSGGGGVAAVKVDPAALNSSRPPREDGEARAAAVVVGGQPTAEGKRGGGGVGARKGGGVGHSPPKSNGFRQILLLQLELIEQQQLQLQNKSREIDELKAEKETLLARIERMERRLQLGKKEGGSGGEQRPCRSTLPGHTPHREDRDPPGSAPGALGGQEALPQGCDGSTGGTPRRLHYGRGGKGHKRRFLFQDPRSAKRRAQAKSALQREALGLKAEPVGGVKEKGEEGRAVEEEEGAAARPDRAHGEEPAHLTTTDMYLSRWHHQPPPSPCREPAPAQEESVAMELCLPSWRENVMDPLEEEEASDITENLDDVVFLKRHSKHELDEKRRKRWDIQRIREQRMFQRLQQRMNKRKGIQESEPEVLSFYPEAEDVEALVVTPHLPVVAFGRPLPKMTRRSFDLPWLDERSRCRADGPKKQTPHRTCRK